MASGHDRRGFFKHLLREAAGVAQEMSAFRRDLESTAEEPEPWPPPPVPASPAHGTVDEAALLSLCEEAGLKQRAAEVGRLARVSVRLTRGEPGARSHLGGSPDLPGDFAWPTWDGHELGFLGQLDLEQVAEVEASLPLPRTGLLLFFYDLATRPSGLVTTHRGSCRVVHVERARSELAPDESRTPALRELPIEMSRELMLPGAWSFHAEELELTADEIDAWDQLRERLAARQGVELEESSVDRFALHRLLGYQDELGREVEFDCQLTSAGLDADDVTVYYEARADHEEQAREWHLLFQLSADRTLATPREDFERLYICIRDADLRAGRVDPAWAILR
jgi:uncharacterized protein YwqG